MHFESFLPCHNPSRYIVTKQRSVRKDSIQIKTSGRKTYLTRLDQSLPTWKHHLDGGQSDSYHHGGNPEVYQKNGKLFLGSGSGMLDYKKGNKQISMHKEKVDAYNFIYTTYGCLLLKRSGWQVWGHLGQDMQPSQCFSPPKNTGGQTFGATQQNPAG